jgi:hypothetical protein
MFVGIIWGLFARNKATARPTTLEIFNLDTPPKTHNPYQVSYEKMAQDHY